MKVLGILGTMNIYIKKNKLKEIKLLSFNLKKKTIPTGKVIFHLCLDILINLIESI